MWYLLAVLALVPLVQSTGSSYGVKIPHKRPSYGAHIPVRHGYLLKPLFLRKPCSVNRFVVQPKFDLSRALGRWYIINELNPAHEEDRELLDTVAILSKDHYFLNRIHVRISGREDDDESDCKVFNDSLILTKKPGRFLSYSNYGDAMALQIVATDYYNWAFLYGCGAFDPLDGTCKEGHVKAQLWSRQPFLDYRYRYITRQVAASVCLDLDEDIPAVPQGNADCTPDAFKQAIQYSYALFLQKVLRKPRPDGLKGIGHPIPLTGIRSSKLAHGLHGHGIKSSYHGGIGYKGISVGHGHFKGLGLGGATPGYGFHGHSIPSYTLTYNLHGKDLGDDDKDDDDKDYGADREES